MANIRMSRINGELQKSIANVVSNKLKNPNLEGLIISITDVQTHPDLSLAKVGISVLSNDETKEYVVSELNHSKNYIRREVMREVRLRVMPDLVFYLDDFYEKSKNVLNLLDKISKQ